MASTTETPESGEALAEPRESGEALARRTFVRLSWAAILSNGIGAVVVFLFLTFLLPVAGEPDQTDELVVRNAIIFVVYMAIALPIGLVWSRRLYEPVAAWLRDERAPTPEERQTVLRSPVTGVIASAGGWGGAAVLFTLVNISEPLSGALTIGLTIALGGATTSALAYLLFERLMRPVLSRVLVGGVPQRPVAPGVAGRLTMAWMLGTGVPALGVIGVATAVLTGSDLDERLALGAVLFLAAVVLAVGLAAITFAARSVADPVEGMRGALGRVEEGDFEARVPVEDGSEVGLLQAGFNRMAAGLAEREQIREAFGTYVDRDVAEHILEEGVSLEGEEVEVTVMFLDVRDFTGFAERSSAREVVGALNGLFEGVVPVVHSHGGHVDKFIGDGLLAVFGAPRRQPDHADRALAAAVEIARATSEPAGPRLEIGIGLNSGVVVAGNVGGADRLEFSVIGDAVNVAARVEAATRQTGDAILLTEDTRRLLRDSSARLEERPGVELKGKREPVALYAHLGEHTAG